MRRTIKKVCVGLAIFSGIAVFLIVPLLTTADELFAHRMHLPDGLVFANGIKCDYPVFSAYSGRQLLGIPFAG
ncbi:MAG: hypothetical protein SFH39_01565 [Candidatus Magnetobacterium sp. LHC-1]|uniref:Secreted protein n=1 Tax=Candidatus Magnetobacterium casense TaxID=1455061 RepID=A0ABS6S155_9BACT|nr:hypothetical protein [Candidatus Magnetobacterium casensis]MBF0607801.1 hypothetical protein [Nitrospirota bacterium]MBV6342582.1 hypothetical protein [Candidatus Magnetobacterium casensis]